MSFQRLAGSRCNTIFLRLTSSWCSACVQPQGPAGAHSAHHRAGGSARGAQPNCPHVGLQPYNTRSSHHSFVTFWQELFTHSNWADTLAQ